MVANANANGEKEDPAPTIRTSLVTWEVKNAFDMRVKARARARRRRGEPVTAGELKGPAHLLARVVRVLLSLSDADWDWIEAEADRLVGNPPAPRTGSVLVREPGPDAGHGAGGTRPPERGRKPKRPDQAVAPVAGPDHRPVRV